ncbi:MAG TPA: hypothetical protein VLI07_10595 [Candidatus Binatus sp.]|nr:hypothetical protein [Candidatus Binatus sp.]
METAKLSEDVQQTARVIQDNLARGIGRVQESVAELSRDLPEARRLLTSANGRLVSLVQESPLLTVAGAFALGYLIAKVARSFA